MTVNVGPKRFLGATTLLGASQFLGQGNTNTAADVEYELLFSTDDALVSIPTWIYVTQWLRAFSTSRGRPSELQEMDAGTATLTLDNRDRRFDPANTQSPYAPNLRPMNRMWLRVRFNGLTHDVFKGYVESYEQQFPGTVDAVTVVRLADEFKVLSLANVPVMTPPRDTYQDLIQSDRPDAYWPMTNDVIIKKVVDAAVGKQLSVGFVAGITIGALFDGAIVGDNPAPYAALALGGTTWFTTWELDAREAPDLGGLNACAVELWFMCDSLPAGTRVLAQGPVDAGGVRTYTLTLSSAGVPTFTLRNSTPSNIAVSAGSIIPGQWTHIVAAVSDLTLRLYLNGTEVTGTPWSLVVASAGLPPTFAQDEIDFEIGDRALSVPSYFYFDEIAVYRYGLPADRVLAHYVAGTQRGFMRTQLPHQRIGAVLDSVSNQAPRNIRASARQMTGSFMHGQAPIEEVKAAAKAEAIDAVVFIAGDGTVTFLDSAHRGASPWNTVQATFGDGGGTEFEFTDVQLDYSDAFIANEWNVTRDAGTTTSTTRDDASVSQYLKRPQSITGLELINDSDVTAISAAMLAKYKNPFTRVIAITPNTMNVNVIDAVFQLELGDRIRILKSLNSIPALYPSATTYPSSSTYPGPLRFDQELFIQSISIDATPQAICPTVKLGVSPV
jgi:Concanavalin A-like lectin/glucanases superfamily